MHSSNLNQNHIRIYYCRHILYINVDIYANNLPHAVIYIVTSFADVDFDDVYKCYCGSKFDHNI
jgi:hypothetical protein